MNTLARSAELRFDPQALDRKWQDRWQRHARPRPTDAVTDPEERGPRFPDLP